MQNEYIREDYVHSANSLFHFMSSSKYLIDALKRKALCPRYCNEDIGYLKISTQTNTFKEIAVLQKCFCDIPLSNVLKPFPVKLTDNNDGLTNDQLKSVPDKFSHPELYGKYALAFSKRWGEESKLQPIHYLSEDAYCASNFSKMFNIVLSQDDVDDTVSDTLLNWICFMKPIRGTMKRRGETKEKIKFEYEIYKNFHDEHEWRYVPFNTFINGKPLDSVIANANLLNISEQMKNISDNLEKYKETWLPFAYKDLRYIIVPDINGRVDVINAINEFDDSLFEENSQLDRSILISKILVLEEIEKDM